MGLGHGWLSVKDKAKRAQSYLTELKGAMDAETDAAKKADKAANLTAAINAFKDWQGSGSPEKVLERANAIEGGWSDQVDNDLGEMNDAALAVKPPLPNRGEEAEWIGALKTMPTEIARVSAERALRTAERVPHTSADAVMKAYLQENEADKKALEELARVPEQEQALDLDMVKMVEDAETAIEAASAGADRTKAIEDQAAALRTKLASLADTEKRELGRALERSEYKSLVNATLRGMAHEGTWQDTSGSHAMSQLRNMFKKAPQSFQGTCEVKPTGTEGQVNVSCEST